ncbi:MAG: glycogen/starch synthase [Bacteroidia bacterium]|nr:glycogen/starch synthase [Bacteroidia bacterium]
MEEKTRILFVVHEMAPFLELSSIAKLTRELPQAIQEKGFEIRCFMPRFGSINERRNRLHEVIRLSGMNIVVNDTDNPLIIKVASIPQARMQVYFLDNEDYFQKKQVFHNSKNAMLKDNDEKALFFCKGVIETVKKLGWMPDIVHCHDWFAGLLPVLLKTKFANDPIFSESKVIYSAYENSFSGELSDKYAKLLEMEGIDSDALEHFKKATCTNLQKAAIQYADATIKGSEKLDSGVESYFLTQESRVVDYQTEETYVDTYFDFYKELLEENLVLAE